MDKRGIYPKLNKEYILERLDPERIMAFYTGIPVIEHYFTGNTFCNPFREDITPTCNYYYSTVDDKLRMRDYAGRSVGHDDRMFNADIFDVVALRHKLNTSDRNSFKLILNIIAKDFKIHIYEDPNEVINFNQFLTSQRNFKTKLRIIKIVPRAWNKSDEQYWYTKYGISSNNLKKHKVVPVEQIWLEDRNGLINRVYLHKNNDPAYGYYGGKENDINIWKVYFPFRRHKSQSKIITNKAFMQGFDTLLPSSFGLITKSYKDVMALKEYGIQSVSLASESIPPSIDEIFKIKINCHFVFSLLDFDRAGIRMALYLKRHYGIEPLMFTKGWYGSVDYGVKDFSDCREAYGYDKTLNIIKETMDKYSDCLNYSNKLIYNAWQMY
jgi:hypothetical protein